MKNTGAFIAFVALGGILLATSDKSKSAPASSGASAVKMSLGIDSPLVNVGATSNGTLVWDPAGFWDVWKNGRTVNLNQYNGEAIAAGMPTITAPPAPSTFDYHAVGLNIPTYNR